MSRSTFAQLLKIGAIAALAALSACSRKPGSSGQRNRAPIIQAIPQQSVDEGKTLRFTLAQYISDPEKETVTLEKLSGPGLLDIGYPYLFVYQNIRDEDIVDNVYTVQFRAIDSSGNRTNGSFDIQQQDTYPTVLTPVTQRLSSGLESLILDAFGGYVEPHRRTQVSLGVNSQNEPLLIYEDGSSPPYGGIFSSAYRFMGSWVKKEIGNRLFGGSYSSVAFDRANRAHLCFDQSRQSQGEGLAYGLFFGTGSWYLGLIDTNLSVGLDNDLAIDGQNNGHMSYFSWAANRVKYAYNATTNLRIEDLADSAWNQTSLALDTNDKAHIVHVTPGGAVQYLTNESGSWSRSMISTGTNPIIRRDRQGTLHAIFQRSGFPSLYHATKNNSTWNIESLPASTTLSAGNRLSCEIDTNNKLTICYLSGGRENIYVMTNSRNQWREHLLDNSGNWVNPRIALDQQNALHIIGGHQGWLQYTTFQQAQLPP